QRRLGGDEPGHAPPAEGAGSVRGGWQDLVAHPRPGDGSLLRLAQYGRHVSCVSPLGQNQPAMPTSVPTTPATSRAALPVSAPNASTSSPTVSRNGQYEGWGMATTASGTASSRPVDSVMCPSVSGR